MHDPSDQWGAIPREGYLESPAVDSFEFRGRILRFICVAAGITASVQALALALIWESPGGAFFDAFFAALYFGNLHWISRGFYRFATYWMLFAIEANILGGVILFVGRDPGFQYYLLLAGPTSGLVFAGKSSYWHKFVLGMSGVVMFVLCDLTRNPVWPAAIPPMQERLLYLGNLTVLVVGSVLIVHLFSRELLHLHREQQRLVMTDALTGLFNRRYILPQAERLLQLAVRHSRPFSVILVDIDHFKSINDTCGHAVGDEVIQRLADHMRSSLRSSDIVARIGGEEFLLILPETPLRSAVVVAEKLRREIAASPLAEGAAPLGNRLSVSLGAAELETNEETVSLEELMSRADSALYHAKNTGRNRLVCWPLPPDMVQDGP